MRPPRVVSLCSGAGLGDDGLKLHFEMALAVDSNWRCCCSHMANHPRVPVKHADVRDDSLVRWAAGTLGRADGIVHTPPCPPFSTAGPHNPADPRAAVFLAVLPWAETLNPASVVVENVPGIRRSPYLAILKERLRFLGYQVEDWLLDAASFGAPQHRQRLFVVAVRASLPFPNPSVPTHGPDLLPYRTVGDAFADLTEDEALFLGVAPLSAKRRRMLALVPPGGNWCDLPPGLQAAVVASCDGRKPHRRICHRLSWDETPGTILTGASARTVNFGIHPIHTRPLSVVEHLRLQGIARPFRVFGSVKQRYEMAGNGVPPALMAAVAGAVAKALGGANESAPENFLQKSCGDLQRG